MVNRKAVAQPATTPRRVGPRPEGACEAVGFVLMLIAQYVTGEPHRLQQARLNDGF